MMIYYLLSITYKCSATSCAEDEFLFQNSVCKRCDEYIPSCSRCETGTYSPITNGSFEEYDLSSRTWEYYDAIPGWYPDEGDVIELKKEYSAYDGDQYLEVVATDNSKVNQDLSTEANYWYTIEFYYSPTPQRDANTNSVNIYWDNSIIDTINVYGGGLSNHEWTFYNYTNRATSSSTQLAFESASTNGNSRGAAIDLVNYFNLPHCTECLSYYYYSIATNTCESCPSYHGNCSECEEIEGSPSCKVCVQGFYPSAGDCASCGSHCEDCDTSGNCLSCLTGYFVDGNSCSSCPSNCNNCDSNGDCIDCESPYIQISGVCVICNSPCTSCDTSGNCLSCLNGYFVDANGCSSCPEHCLSCDSNRNCFECLETYEIEGGECKCPDYFLIDSLTSMCYYSPLDFNLQINSDSYTILFTENLSSYLSLSNIESRFLPSGSIFEFVLSPVSLRKYELRIDSSIIPSDSSGINIKLSNVIGESGSELIKDEFDTQLLTYETIESSNTSEDSDAQPEEEEIIEGMSLEDLSMASVGAGLIVSICVSLLSGNSSALWIFVNFSLMIYYMPLQNINMPVSLRELCKGFGTDLFGIILNFATIFPYESDSLQTKRLWRVYGIENTSFYENTGNVIFLFSIGLVLFPVLSIFYFVCKLVKLKSASSFLRKAIVQYRWNFFLRASIESYIEVLSSSILCSLTVFEKSVDAEIVISIILCVICVLIPVIATLGTCKFKDVLTCEDSDLTKFSSYFEEFKTQQLGCLLYYPLFYFRRLVYMIGIYFLYDYPLSQVIANSSFSFVVFGYIVIYKPYKNTLEGILSGITELFLGLIFIATGFCLVDLSEEQAGIVGKVTVYGIFSLIGANMLISIVYCFKCLRTRSKRKENQRKYETNQATNSIFNKTKVSVSNNLTRISMKYSLNYEEEMKSIDVNSIY